MDTIETITIDNSTYTIEVTGDKNFPYMLHGEKGAAYSLIRNLNTGNLLPFSVTKSNLSGVFTDINGKLEKLND